MKKYLILLISLSLLALWPFFRRGFFESDDGEWMVIRFSAFHQTLRAGQIPVRFVERLNNNYGYPVLNFLYPLPFYLAEIPKLLGFGYLSSIKLIFILSTIISTVGMFWALSQNFSKIAAFSGAVVYLFVPYHLVDLYTRGSLGEILALAIVPLIYGSILKIKSGNGRFFPILSVLIGLLITAHNVIALLFLSLFLLYMQLEQINTKKVLICISLGIALSAFFSIPAIYDLHYVRLSHISVSNVDDHLVSLSSIFSPVPLKNAPVPIQIGLVPTVILLASLLLLIKKNKIKDLFLLTVFSIAAIFLMTNLSAFVWQALPPLKIIQFPWRLASIVLFSVSALTAFTVDHLNKKLAFTFLLVLASLSSSIPYTKPAKFVDRDDSFYATNEATTTVMDEYLPLWVKQKSDTRAAKRFNFDQQLVSVKSLTEKPLNYQAKTSSVSDSPVIVNAIYFPGWNASIDGKSVPINYQNPFGLISFKLPKGEHQVIIKYQRTGLHLFSEVVSSFAALIIGVFFYLEFKKIKFK